MTMTYAQEQRQRMIDFLLHEYGTLNRGALVDYFGISMPQASRDIQDYLQRAPGNAVYDATAKKYLRGANFKRIYA